MCHCTVFHMPLFRPTKHATAHTTKHVPLLHAAACCCPLLPSAACCRQLLPASVCCFLLKFADASACSNDAACFFSRTPIIALCSTCHFSHTTKHATFHTNTCSTAACCCLLQQSEFKKNMHILFACALRAFCPLSMKMKLCMHNK